MAETKAENQFALLLTMINENLKAIENKILEVTRAVQPSNRCGYVHPLIKFQYDLAIC